MYEKLTIYLNKAKLRTNGLGALLRNHKVIINDFNTDDLFVVYGLPKQSIPMTIESLGKLSENSVYTISKVYSESNLKLLYPSLVKNIDNLKELFNKVFELSEDFKRSVYLSKRRDVCPYCQTAFTYKFEKKMTKFVKAYDLDHYYDKKEFFIFAITLSNLTPTCLVCNQRAKKKIDTNVFYNDISKLTGSFNLEISIDGLININNRKLKKSEFDIIYSSSISYEKKFVDEVVFLTDRYNELKDEIIDFIFNYVSYNKSRLNSFLELIDEPERTIAKKFVTAMYEDLRKTNMSLMNKLKSDLVYKYNVGTFILVK